MRKIIKKVFWAWDSEKEEKWLNEMSAKGLALVDYTWFRYAFEELGMKKVWCGYYDGNIKSKRVQEKCGFRYEWTTENVDVPLMNEKRTGHVNSLSKEEWQAIRDS